MSGELATLWEWRATLDAGVSLTTGEAVRYGARTDAD